MKQNWWLSTVKMTILVRTENEIIVEAAPIVRKFKKQPLQNLRNWLNKQEGYLETKI